MTRVTIRFDDTLYRRIASGASESGTSTAAYIRDILDRYEGTDAAGYHARFDELQAATIQIFAIMVATVGAQTPDLLAKGMREARILLFDRGLLDPEVPQS
ncbi:hypothetical protein [Sphingobium yanoikuyae]|uniref:CopG family transcriptional regulator n=1 Tax=Sphingobium yanoikuyae TaxID=13690 RepID=A0A291MXW5_SPHYA|nr:hypothetical protein [Sphingobium yanoikuyae]ATI79831.1 hypothetical protein A6768_07195 [Sphingobium yanoikuyae]